MLNYMTRFSMILILERPYTRFSLDDTVYRIVAKLNTPHSVNFLLNDNTEIFTELVQTKTVDGNCVIRQCRYNDRKFSANNLSIAVEICFCRMRLHMVDVSRI